MADNVEITAGAGVTIHADEYTHGTLGSGKTQLIKLVDGTLESDTPVTVDVGAKANALRVCPANDINDPTYIGNVKVTSGAITETNSGSILTAVQLIDNAIDGTEMQVDIVAALPAGTNLIGKVGIDQTTPGTTNRVDIGALIPGVGATNLGKTEDAGHTTGDTGVMMLGVRNDSDTELAGTDLDYCPIAVDLHGHIIVTGSQDGQTAVDYTHGLHGICGIVLDTLPATDIIAGAGEWGVFQMTQYGEMRVKDESANTLLGTIDSDTNDIKTAVESLDNAVDGNYLNCNMCLAGNDAVAGEGNIDSNTLRVTIATDDDGVAHLNTIAGAVSATHMQCDIVAGTITTVSTVTNLAQMGGVAITLDEGVHGVGVQRVTIATDDDGVLSLGIMDDWDATHDSVVSADGPQVMGSYDSTKPAAVGDGDAVRLLADAYGRLLAGVEPQAFQAVFNSDNASGEGNAIHESAASTIIVVQSYVISVDAEMWVELQEEDSSELTGKFYLKAGGGVALTLPDKAPLVLAVDSDLEVITEGAGKISVSVTGYTIPG